MFNKRLLGLSPASKKYILEAAFFNWLCMLSNIAVVLTVCRFFQASFLAKAEAARLLPQTALILIICGLARVACLRLSAKASRASSQNAKKTLREKIFTRLAEMGGEYSGYISTAEAVQLGGEGVEQLEAYFGRYMPQLFYAVFSSLTLFAALSFIDLTSAVILLVCIPLIPLSIMAVQKFAKKLLGRYWNAYTDLGDTFLENLQGLTTLKIYGADGEKHRKMNENAEAFRKATMRVLIMQLNSITAMDLIAYGGAAAGIAAGILGFAAGRVTLFGAAAIMLLSADFFLPMRQLGSFFHTAMNGSVAADKIIRLLDIPLPQKETRSLEKELSGCCLKLENLSFSYEKGSPVLKDISMELPGKKLYFLAGKSGCGKSTLAALLSGRLRGYEGSVKIGGHELRECSRESLARLVTLVDHNSYIFQGTVEYNLKMANPGATGEEMLAALEAADLLDFIKSEKGLHTELSEQGANLSGGQRQRLALARALLHDTPAYIFDEAASNVDAESEEAIMRAVRVLAETKTVILISHRLANAVHADKIHVLGNGILAESGAHPELMDAGGLYASIYNRQSYLENFGREALEL